VPYWTVFGTQTSRAGLDAYLDSTEPCDEIRALLFSHGTDSIGLASAEDWRDTAARARKVGVLTGVNASAYPRDFTGLVHSHRDLAKIRTRYPMPPPLGIDDATAALAGRDHVLWRPSG
jgi:hypothetical protein